MPIFNYTYWHRGICSSDLRQCCAGPLQCQYQRVLLSLGLRTLIKYLEFPVSFENLPIKTWPSSLPKVWSIVLPRRSRWPNETHLYMCQHLEITMCGLTNTVHSRIPILLLTCASPQISRRMIVSLSDQGTFFLSSRRPTADSEETREAKSNWFILASSVHPSAHKYF